jgi:hypothetical protein
MVKNAFDHIKEAEAINSVLANSLPDQRTWVRRAARHRTKRPSTTNIDVLR